MQDCRPCRRLIRALGDGYVDLIVRPDPPDHCCLCRDDVLLRVVANPLRDVDRVILLPRLPGALTVRDTTGDVEVADGLIEPCRHDR